MQRFTPYIATSPCNLCSGTEGTIVSTKDRHGVPLLVTCCRACGLAYIDPLPSAEELQSFYATRYRLEYKAASAPRMKHIYRAGKNALERFKRVALLTRPGARVLDCGAGGGEFTYLLTSRGYLATGIEPNDGYRNYARQEYQVDIQPGTMEQAEFDENEFSLITTFHVLEHLRDPAGALKRLASWLKPGGHLYIEVPNALTAVSSPSNLYHRAHLFYFSAEPLAALAQKAGFSTVLIDGASNHANLTAVFQKTSTQQQLINPVSSAHDAVVNANRHRNLTSYLTSKRTLSQAIPRLLERSGEKSAAKAATDGRLLLDRLFNSEAPLVGAINPRDADLSQRKAA